MLLALHSREACLRSWSTAQKSKFIAVDIVKEGVGVHAPERDRADHCMAHAIAAKGKNVSGRWVPKVGET